MSTADEAAALFQQFRDELGFVNTAQCREKDLYVVRRGGTVVGAALGNHCVRKPQTTLYDIAVDREYQGEGIGLECVRRMWSDSPHEKMITKCPASLPSVQFYNETGWTLIDVEDGKNVPLTVWRYTDD